MRGDGKSLEQSERRREESSWKREGWSENRRNTQTIGRGVATREVCVSRGWKYETVSGWSNEIRLLLSAPRLGRATGCRAFKGAAAGGKNFEGVI